MSVFDLVFLIAVLASLVTTAVAAIAAVRGRGRSALAILKTYAVCVAGYLFLSVLVSYLKPQRILDAGDSWCFDDWCLIVEKVDWTPGPALEGCRVEFRIFSRARRVSQRARGAWIYLVDDRGHLYSPDPEPSEPPLDVLLQPLQSVKTSRTFHVPANVGELGLITGHGGPYCGPMNFLIIGSGGCLFNRPDMIRVNHHPQG